MLFVPKYLIKGACQAIKIVPLSQATDFEIYKKIITNAGVALTSSWIESAFPETKQIQNLSASEADKQLKAIFEKTENIKKLKDQFKAISGTHSSDKCGYYKIVDAQDNLLGGCGLVPIDKTESKLEKADVSLHILPDIQQKGLGTTAIHALLQYGFDNLKLKEIWGSSQKNNFGTVSVCSQFGMIIKNKESLKYYYIDSEMWNIVKQKLEIINNRPISACDEIYKPKSFCQSR